MKKTICTCLNNHDKSIELAQQMLISLKQTNHNIEVVIDCLNYDGSDLLGIHPNLTINKVFIDEPKKDEWAGIVVCHRAGQVQRLLEQGRDAVLYCDTDILVRGSLSNVFEKLTHDTLFVKHRPATSSEWNFFNAGIAGFGNGKYIRNLVAEWVSFCEKKVWYIDQHSLYKLYVQHSDTVQLVSMPERWLHSMNDSTTGEWSEQALFWHINGRKKKQANYLTEFKRIKDNYNKPILFGFYTDRPGIYTHCANKWVKQAKQLGYDYVCYRVPGGDKWNENSWKRLELLEELLRVYKKIIYVDIDDKIENLPDLDWRKFDVAFPEPFQIPEWLWWESSPNFYKATKATLNYIAEWKSNLQEGYGLHGWQCKTAKELMEAGKLKLNHIPQKDLDGYKYNHYRKDVEKLNSGRWVCPECGWRYNNLFADSSLVCYNCDKRVILQNSNEQKPSEQKKISKPVNIQEFEWPKIVETIGYANARIKYPMKYDSYQRQLISQ